MKVQTRNRARHPAGASLLLVLWAVGVLSFATFTAGLLVREDLELVGGRKLSLHARTIAESGIAIGASPTIAPGDPVLQGELGMGEYQVHVTSEESRLNINTLLTSEEGVETLRNLLQLWGVDERTSRSFVDALQDFVDPDPFSRLNGAERDYYRSQGRPDLPLNRAFQSLEEVLLVRGAEEIVAQAPDWRDALSVYSTAKLDLQGAAPITIAAASGVSLEKAEVFVQQRKGADGLDGTEDDPLAGDLGAALSLLGIPPDSPASSMLAMGGKTRRIESQGLIGYHGVQITVVMRLSNAATSRILARSEKAL